MWCKAILVFPEIHVFQQSSNNTKEKMLKNAERIIVNIITISITIPNGNAEIAKQTIFQGRDAQRRGNKDINAV